MAGYTYGLGGEIDTSKYRKGENAKPKRTKICAWCGDEFETSDPRKRFCTNEGSILPPNVLSCAELHKRSRDRRKR